MATHEGATPVAFGFDETIVAWITPENDGDEEWDGGVINLPLYHHKRWLTFGEADALVANLNAAIKTAKAHRDYLIDSGQWVMSKDEDDEDDQVG